MLLNRTIAQDGQDGSSDILENEIVLSFSNVLRTYNMMHRAVHVYTFHILRGKKIEI